MKKNEHDIFGDIPLKGKNRFHSAVLTSYSIDLIHFDSQELGTLHRKQMSSINVIADQKQLDQSISFVNTSYLHHIGREYALNGVKSLGAFHPKVNFFLGDDCAMLLLGTGNLTVPGHGKNHELFTGLMVEPNFDREGGVYMLLQESWRYIKHFAKNCGGYALRRICKELPQNCSVIEDDDFLQADSLHALYVIDKDLSASLLYNEETSGILYQASRHIPLHDVLEVTIISPFFDEDGAMLRSLADLCPNAKIDVMIQPDCALPPNKMPPNARILFYDFDQSERVKESSLKGNKSFRRRLHAKLMHFATAAGEYCIVGSANATIAGMGTLSARGVNDEFCILYYSAKRHFLKELGLSKYGKLPVSVSDMERKPSSTGTHSSNYQVHLCSVEYSSGCFSIVLDSVSKKESTMLLLVNCGGEKDLILPIEFDKEFIGKARGSIHDVCCASVLVNAQGEVISNWQFVTQRDRLDITNPSYENRKINKIISQIESEGYSGLEVTEILGELMRDAASVQAKQKTIHSSSSDKRVRKELPNIEYKAEYDQELGTQESFFNHQGAASRLLDCIEENIRQTVHAINEDQSNENETANSEVSHDRNIVLTQTIQVTKTMFRSLPQQVNGLLKNYDLLRKAREKQIIAGRDQIGQEDFNYFAISLFAATEICFLNHEQYQFEDEAAVTKYSNESISEERSLFFDHLLACMTRSGIAALCNFVLFCQNLGEKPQDDDLRNKAVRAVRYALIFATLFQKYATEEHFRFKGWIIDLSLINLFHYLKLSFDEEIIDSLKPIAERYNNEFRTEDVLKLFRSIEDKINDYDTYPYYEGYGRCLRQQGKKLNWLSEQDV